MGEYRSDICLIQSPFFFKKNEAFAQTKGKS